MVKEIAVIVISGFILYALRRCPERLASKRKDKDKQRIKNYFLENGIHSTEHIAQKVFGREKTLEYVEKYLKELEKDKLIKNIKFDGDNLKTRLWRKL